MALAASNQPIAQAFQVGSICVDPPLLLAPMEDVSNVAFRAVAKRIGGPGLMFTEFVSAMAVHYGARKTIRKMRIDPIERPLGIQIFGGDPDTMAETARLAESIGADLIDINMGCWVPKVCRTGAGAALLKDPDLAERIVRAVVQSVSIPVSVKVRAGYDYGLFAAPELAMRFEAAGAKMITLHARFAEQGFEGEADWKLISAMRKAVAVPLIGNGDVKTPADAIRMIKDTGCNGVMVGRAAISNPWVLARIRAALQGQPEPPLPTIHDRVAAAKEHLRRLIDATREAGDSDPETWAVRHLRGQLPMYIKGEFGAAQIRDRLYHCSAEQEVTDILDELIARHDHPSHHELVANK